MGVPPTVLHFSTPVLLVAAMTAVVTSSGQGDKPLFEGAADHELSAAAMNVRVDFQPYERTWNMFKKTFGRRYESEAEHTHRYLAFLDNVRVMEQHNARFRNGTTTFWMGINQFADKTVEEYRAFSKGLAPSNMSQPWGTLKCSPFVPPPIADDDAASDTVDWRKKGYVTEVKNQEKCGSCWAFSTTGSLEGQHFRKTGRLVSLSEQQLVDCAGTFGPKGCRGGNEPSAYAYIHSAGGINSEVDYPYEAQQGKCRFAKDKIAATLQGCRVLPSGNEKTLQSALGSQGPISVNVDATPDSFRFYAGGVYEDPKCRNNPKSLGHAVLSGGADKKGFGSKTGWGSRWGMQGYMLLARNHDNMCGVATEANFPVV
ncbi:digestive cysteine proteinase 2-like [Babylonia areolata]|uniref:digestive cysteine proteinase 2-like n=1 Tax=Babylonia areolata TaxID=304850 RepID=UPI003FD4AA2F